jgi:hypothetical protein
MNLSSKSNAQTMLGVLLFLQKTLYFVTEGLKITLFSFGFCLFLNINSFQVLVPYLSNL